MHLGVITRIGVEYRIRMGEMRPRTIGSGFETMVGLERIMGGQDSHKIGIEPMEIRIGNESVTGAHGVQ
jgi:hypothetical protein